MAPRQSSIFSSSPAMSKGFDSIEVRPGDTAERMTLNGTVNITAFLLATVLLFAVVGWFAPVLGLALALGLVAFGLIMFMSFKPHLAPKLALAYSVLQGYVVGTVSAYYNAQYDGVVLQALGMTMAIFTVLLLVYRTGKIKPSQNFKLGVMAATGGIALFYLVTIGLSFFGVNMPLVNSNSTYGIIFSVFVVVLASANLVLDFDFIEDGVANGAPKYMEWFGAAALIATLVWLYLELLRLFAKIASNR